MNNVDQTIKEITFNDRLEKCETMKRDYYTKCIKMLYNWSYMTEDEIKPHVNALGLFDYVPAITWLLTHKSTLNVEINTNLAQLFKCAGYDDYHAILDRLKCALVVCNKAQSINILTAIALNSSDPKHDVYYLSIF